MSTGPTSAHSNEAAIPSTGSTGADDRAESEYADIERSDVEHVEHVEHADVEHADSETSEYGDPVGELVRAAVSDRPLEDIAHLITLLEQSPEYAEATVAALRAVGVGRSVEDVTRLVALLTRPPRDAASADEAIRAAAESRPVAEVTRLLALLHRTPLEPHCGEEAVRAAAAGRPVEELVDLIGRLADEQRRTRAEPPQREPAPQPAEAAEGLDTHSGPVGLVEAPSRGLRRTGRPVYRRQYRAPDPATMPVARPVRFAVLALGACAVLSFPLDRDGASAPVYGFALAVSAVCALLAFALTVRPSVPMLAAAVVVPAAPAAGQLFEGRVDSAELSRVLDLPLAPAWLAGTAAVCASLVALTALVACLAVQPPRRPTPRPMAEAQRVRD
ncbi:hypothetical protein AB0I77_25765 [Streptomyces sp. NPDC050619]|uniref:hypothetical protein n=1 Tax=Streptomyces sp. NPDC050619 TaxID=3157214 RepID=UPI003436D157